VLYILYRDELRVYILIEANTQLTTFPLQTLSVNRNMTCQRQVLSSSVSVNGSWDVENEKKSIRIPHFPEN